MAARTPPDRVYLFRENDLLVPEAAPDEALTGGLPRSLVETAFPGLAAGEGAGVYYFEAPAPDGSRGTAGFLTGQDFPLPPGWKTRPLRQSLALFSGGLISGGEPAGRLLRCCHLLHWRRESAFCGRCGSRNGDAPEELARLCPVCGKLEFPRISPAVIVVIINDAGQALLAHNKKFTPGVYSLIAGFNEAGENLEATVAREIREEVGLEVRDIRYVASQPWPFPDSLMVGFCARYAGGSIKPDGIEIEDARWFDRNALPNIPGHGSVSRYLISRWLEGSL